MRLLTLRPQPVLRLIVQLNSRNGCISRIFTTNRIKRPLDLYKERVASGSLIENEHQLRTVEILTRLHDRLASYEPPAIQDQPKSSWLSKVCLEWMRCMLSFRYLVQTSAMIRYRKMYQKGCICMAMLERKKPCFIWLVPF